MFIKKKKKFIKKVKVLCVNVINGYLKFQLEDIMVIYNFNFMWKTIYPFAHMYVSICPYLMIFVVKVLVDVFPWQMECVW